MKLFSIIIPVYNAEATIGRCLDSILCQNTQNAEIIVINDGSTDNSLALCEDYAAKNSNIRLISQQNAGVSAARNAGLDLAGGKYVLFVDSDDAVSLDYLRAITDCVTVADCDLLLFGARKSTGETVVEPKAIITANNAEVGAYLASYMKSGKLSSPWSKAFRTEIIRQQSLRFSEKLAIAEDLTFVSQYCVNAKSVAAISDLLYYVNTENQDSLSRKIRKDLYVSLREASLQILSAVKNADLPDAVKHSYLDAASWLYYRSVYSSGREATRYTGSDYERRKEIRKICRYFAEEHVQTFSWKGFLISLPVRFRAPWLIDWMVVCRNRQTGAH